MILSNAQRTSREEVFRPLCRLDNSLNMKVLLALQRIQAKNLASSMHWGIYIKIAHLLQTFRYLWIRPDDIHWCYWIKHISTPTFGGKKRIKDKPVASFNLDAWNILCILLCVSNLIYAQIVDFSFNTVFHFYHLCSFLFTTTCAFLTFM